MSDGDIILTAYDNSEKLIIEKRDTLVKNRTNSFYIRSFSIIDSLMYIVQSSGDSPYIYEYDYINSFSLRNKYKVPTELRDINYLTKIGNKWYLTAYSSTLVAFNTLDELIKGLYRNCYNETALKGIPYYVTRCDSSYYVAQIDSHSGICELFFNENDEITSSYNIYYYEEVSAFSEFRKRMKYPVTYYAKEIGLSLKIFFHNIKKKILEK